MSFATQKSIVLLRNDMGDGRAPRREETTAVREVGQSTSPARKRGPGEFGPSIHPCNNNEKGLPRMTSMPSRSSRRWYGSKFVGLEIAPL